MSTTSPTTFRETLSAVGRWLRTNTTQVVFYALLGAAGGYLFNTLLLMFAYDGFRVPEGRVGVGEGNVLLGSLGIAIASTIVFSLFGYVRSVGVKRFGSELAALPRQIGLLFQRDGSGARVHLLWGAAVALLARQVIGPGFGALLAIGLLVYLPSILGQVLVRLGMRAVYAIAKLLQPSGTTSPSGLAMAVGVLGTILALGVGYYVQSPMTLLVAAVACGGAAILLSRGGTPTQAAMLIVGLMLPTLLLLDVPLAWADDGGWWEQPGDASLINWLGSAGASTVLIWGAGAVPSAVAGGAIGGALGGVMSGGGWDFSSLTGAGGDVRRAAEGRVDGVFQRQSNDPFERTAGAEGVADRVRQRPEEPQLTGIGNAAEGHLSDILERPDNSSLVEVPGAARGEQALDDVLERPPHEPLEVVSQTAEGSIDADWADRPGDRVIQDDAQWFSGRAPTLMDPDTGEPLIVQDGSYEGGEIGMVWYDEWVTPEEAARRVAERQSEIAAREREIEAWQRESDEMFARNRAERQERYAAEREAETAARAADEARRAREAHIDAGLDRLMEDHLHDPAWMERYEQAQDAAMEGDARALAGLYRDALAEQVQTSAAEADAETRYEQALAVGEWTARGVEMGARGALMAVGGQVVAAHGVIAGVAASAAGMGSIQGASEGADAHAQGKTPEEVIQRTAGGFLAGAVDGAVGTYTGVPGTSAPTRILLPAAADAAQTYVRTGDAGQALASGVIGAVGGAAGEGVDAVLPEGAARTAAGAIVNATAAGSTAVVQGGSFQEGFVQGLASDVATRAGGALGARAGTGLTSDGRALADAPQAHADDEAQRVRAAETEQRARDALYEGNAQRRQPTTIEQQSAAVQALAQTQHDRVRLDADGRVVTDADGNPVTDSFVNARGALDQLRDTAGSRTAKTLDDPNHPGLREAIVRTRSEAIYGPADRATISAVTPRLEEAGIMRPGDRLVMDTFSTPGSTPSLGADRDARLVIERPRVDDHGRPVFDSDGQPAMQRIEVERSHWEQQALSDFARHTQAIATEGGRTITPETHPDYFQRMREGLERQGHQPETVAQMTPQQVLEASGPHGRDHAWAEAHNQLFTDRFHMEASRGNTDQGVQRMVDPDGRVRAEPTQVASNTLEVGAGRAQLTDPEGFARMWQEKSDFYRNNPPEALAQSQKGIAQHMALRDGYRAQGLEPPPLNPQAARAMEIIARAPVGTDATPQALARVEAELQALGFESTGHAMTAVAWQHEGLKWSRPATEPGPPPPPAPGGLSTSQIGALSRGAIEDETTGF